MASTQLVNAIKREKVAVVDDISKFLETKFDNYDEISDLIKEFRDNLSTKKKKKLTFYNDYISKEMKRINSEQKGLNEDDDDFIPKNKRMKEATKCWKKYQPTKNFQKEKDAFEANNNSD